MHMTWRVLLASCVSNRVSGSRRFPTHCFRYRIQAVGRLPPTVKVGRRSVYETMVDEGGHIDCSNGLSSEALREQGNTLYREGKVNQGPSDPSRCTEADEN